MITFEKLLEVYEGEEILLLGKHSEQVKGVLRRFELGGFCKDRWTLHDPKDPTRISPIVEPIMFQLDDLWRICICKGSKLPLFYIEKNIYGGV